MYGFTYGRSIHWSVHLSICWSQTFHYCSFLVYFEIRKFVYSIFVHFQYLDIMMHHDVLFFMFLVLTILELLGF